MTKPSEKVRSILRELGITLAVCAGGVMIGELLLNFDAPLESVVCIYLLADVIVAALTSGYFWGILAACICSLAYSFFVKTPVLVFADMSPYTLLTLFLMLVISVIISSITSKVKEGELTAKRRNDESEALYHLTRDLSTCTTVNDAIELTLRNISDFFHTNCRLLLFSPDEKPQKTFVLLEGEELHPRQPTDTTRDFHEFKVKPEDGYYVQSFQYEWPFYDPEGHVLGAVAIPLEVASRFSDVNKQMVRTMVEAVAIVIDKIRLERREEQSRMEMSQEKYRTGLLRSISHDLRTPLAGMTGSAEVLMSLLEEGSDSWKLAQGIFKECTWLSSLVQNTLSLTKLQDGSMTIHPEMTFVEDVVRETAESMRFRLPKRKITEDYPDDLVSASMDPSLIRQVITNLIDNASKYSPEDSPIELVVREEPENDMVAIHVIDNGIGLSEAAKQKVFKMFYTTKASTPGAMRGFGLGLPICDIIMKMHGGSIVAQNRTDGKKGAEFIARLPMNSDQ